MNRDSCLLHFETLRDDFEEVSCRELEWYTADRPLGFFDLTDFLSARQAPKHRKHISELLSRYHCNDLEGFLSITHALSLNDTYWVKEESSRLCWSEVSLYQHEFDELISSAAFDGRFNTGSLSSTSPEFSTDGAFAKCWVREGSRICLYKTGSSAFEIEPLSEYLACQVANALQLPHVSYDLDYYHGRLISKCNLFTSEEIGLVKAYRLIPRRDRTVSAMLRFFTSIDSDDSFRRMCILDALILNVDRHLGNFGVLVENDSGRILQMAPIYDNNRSLLFDMDDDQLTRLEWCVRTCKPRFGSDFISTAKGLLTPELHNALDTIKDFRFTPHPAIDISANRLEALSRLVQLQAQRILE